MSIIHRMIFISTAMLLFSCTERLKENQNTLNAVTNESEVGEKEDLWEKRRQDRRAIGDTLAMDFKDLQKYLPEELNGYVAVNHPIGESVNTPGMSFSMAEQTYKKGESELTISIIDYNGAHDMYSGATDFLLMSLPLKNEQEEAQGLIIKDNIKAWESYKKKDKKAELTIGIAERFYLNMKMDKQEGTGVIKSLANELDLDALNNL